MKGLQCLVFRAEAKVRGSCGSGEEEAGSILVWEGEQGRMSSVMMEVSGRRVVVDGKWKVDGKEEGDGSQHQHGGLIRPGIPALHMSSKRLSGKRGALPTVTRR